MSNYTKEKYRTGFLKSEQWKDVRIAALAKADAECRICGFRSLSNDGHHVFYPRSVWKTKPDDIVILCRPCHTMIHAILTLKKSMAGHPKGKHFKELRLFLDALHNWKQALDIRGFTIRRLKVKSNFVDSYKKHVEPNNIVKKEMVLEENKTKKPPPQKRCKCCHRQNVKVFERTLVKRPNGNTEEKAHQFWCDTCWNRLQEIDHSSWKNIRLFWESQRVLFRDEVIYETWSPEI